MSLKTGITVQVVAVKVLGGYRLSLTFSDGHVSTIDFGPFLRASQNPETRRFLSIRRFRAFALLHGSIVWGDYEMCFPVEDLYKGRIACGDQRAQVLAVAEPQEGYIVTTVATKATTSSGRRKGRNGAVVPMPSSGGGYGYG
jgi:hypothetical protein